MGVDFNDPNVRRMRFIRWAISILKNKGRIKAQASVFDISDIAISSLGNEYLKGKTLYLPLETFKSTLKLAEGLDSN